MKTVYYTFTTWKEGTMAAGFDGGLGHNRRSVLVRQPEQKPCALGGDKIIDLTAWRGADLDVLEEELREAEELGEADEPERETEAPRARRSRRAVFTAELVSTLCVAAVAVVLIVRILTF